MISLSWGNPTQNQFAATHLEGISVNRCPWLVFLQQWRVLLMVCYSRYCPLEVLLVLLRGIEFQRIDLRLFVIVVKDQVRLAPIKDSGCHLLGLLAVLHDASCKISCGWAVRIVLGLDHRWGRSLLLLMINLKKDIIIFQTVFLSKLFSLRNKPIEMFG